MIGKHGGPAPRTGEAQDPVALWHTCDAEEFQCLQQLRGGFHPNDTDARKQGIVKVISAGKRTGMTDRQRSADLGGWASESFRLPAQAPISEDDPRPPGGA